MRTLFAHLVYGDVNPLSEESAIAEVATWVHGDATFKAYFNDADIARQRSRIACECMDNGYDVCVMVDHDITWLPGMVRRIAKQAFERNAIVGAFVSKRKFGTYGASKSEIDANISELGTDKLIPADYLGGAFTAYPTSMIRELRKMPEVKALHGDMIFLPMIDRDNRDIYLSEDWAICNRAKRAGFGVMLDLMPIVSHHGRMLFNAATCLIGREKEDGAKGS